MQTTRFSVGALMVMSLIITGCLCRPQDSNSKSLKESVPGGAKPLESVTGPTIPSSRMDRLQKPSQGKYETKGFRKQKWFLNYLSPLDIITINKLFVTYVVPSWQVPIVIWPTWILNFTSQSFFNNLIDFPTVLNMGFDEIVVESNLQVHNRVGSKSKSKIMLPSNSTATPMQTNKSARSLLVWRVRRRIYN